MKFCLLLTKIVPAYSKEIKRKQIRGGKRNQGKEGNKYNINQFLTKTII